MRIVEILRKRELSYLTLMIVVVLIVIGSGLIFYNQRVIKETLAIQKQTEAVRFEVGYGFSEITRDVDMTIRGYAVMREKGFLYVSNEGIRKKNADNQRRLDSLLALQNYRDPKGLEALRSYKSIIADYIDYHQTMVDLLQKDSMNTFMKLFAEDKGRFVWGEYSKAKDIIGAFEEDMFQKAKARYEFAMQSNIVVQLLMVFVGLPIIFLVMRKLYRESRQRQALLQQLADNNRKYLFDPGTGANTQTAEQVVGNSIANLQKASDFVEKITAGDHGAEWGDMNEQNRHLNEHNLAGHLVKMREQMKKVKAEDEKRVWASDGLARFSAIVRNNQHNLQTLAEEALRFLTKHLQTQQGSLFVLQGEGADAYLELAACHAFDRKKYVEKRINIGSGLVGQTYLEGETVLLTDIPQGYTSITSGLGDATPTCIVIVPMKYNDTTQAVLELAGFRKFEPYQIEFLEKCGEFVASALLSVRTTERMQMLLAESQVQAEQMKAQEEEMRQNMEELAATQEEMARKSRELESVVESMSHKERDLHESKRWLQTVIDNLPIAIFWKESQNLSFMGVNKVFADVAKSTTEQLIGKTDFDCPWTREESEMFRADDREVLRTKTAKVNIEEQQTNAQGEVTWLRTSKIPVLDENGNAIAILGMFENVTERKLQEQRTKDSALWLQTIINNLPKGIFWKESQSLSFLGANKIFTDIAGFTPETIVGKTDFDCPWKREESEAFRADDREVIAAKTAKIDIEEQNTNANGETQWLKTSKVPIIDEEGKVLAVLGMFEDITAVKNREFDYQEKLQVVSQLQQENEALKAQLAAKNESRSV
ncbi:MAG: PAS domain-containing protein [Cytophagales bacterium]|nr:PAS domain-containing protein [Cytophagales bacterium]